MGRAREAQGRMAIGQISMEHLIVTPKSLHVEVSVYAVDASVGEDSTTLMMFAGFSVDFPKALGRRR